MSLAPQLCPDRLAAGQLEDSLSPTAAFATNSLELLRQQLQFLLKDGYPQVDRVAEATGMSLRSFQRQLSKNQLSYSALIAQVRFETAVSLLQDPAIKLIDISLELGYNDAGSFTRAFKRWSGISPRQFRYNHIQRSQAE